MQTQESEESDLENRAPRFSVTNFVSGKHRRSLISLSLMVACILTSPGEPTNRVPGVISAGSRSNLDSRKI